MYPSEAASRRSKRRIGPAKNLRAESEAAEIPHARPHTHTLPLSLWFGDPMCRDSRAARVHVIYRFANVEYGISKLQERQCIMSFHFCDLPNNNNWDYFLFYNFQQESFLS